MTVRDLIGLFNDHKILDGKIAFKVIRDGRNGEKWFFYCDQKKTPTKTVDEFCSHEGIAGCMNLVIPDYYSDIDIGFETSDDDNEPLLVKCHCMDKDELKEIYNER